MTKVTIICPYCDGKGKITKKSQEKIKTLTKLPTCGECNGTGKIKDLKE
jgi:DnaJ-class molecular chaperone